MKTKKQAIIAVLLITIAMMSCKESHRQAQPEEFAAYINGFTTGFISGFTPVIVDLAAAPVLLDDEPGSEVTQPLFAFEPNVKGKTYRVSETRFSFVPDEPWPRDTDFKVTFFLNRLTDVPKEFHLLSFRVKTLPLSFSIGEPALVPTLVADVPAYRLEAIISFSEKPGIVEINAFNLKLDKKNHAFKIEPTDNVLEYKLVVDQIERSSAKRSLVLTWDGAKTGSISTGTLTVDIPSVDHFSVERVQVINHPDQKVVIQFSDMINLSQNKEGLISLQDKVVSIKTENNTVSLFPEEVLSGSFELLVAAGLETSVGTKLKQDYRTMVNFDLPPPQVKFSGKGVIMVGNKNRKLPFQAIGLKAVDVSIVQIFADNMIQFLQNNSLEGSNNLKSTGRLIARKHLRLDTDPGRNLHRWNNYIIDLDELIKGKEGSLFRVYIRFTREDAVYGCESVEQEIMQNRNSREDITADDMRPWAASSWYNPDYYYPPGFRWDERDNPCHDSYYYYERFDSRNVMASGIGLIVKDKNLASKEYVLYATNLETARPVTGAKVELYDYQQQLISSGQTGSDGSVVLKADLVVPFIAVASHQGNHAWVKMEPGVALSMARFDVSGNQLQQGTKGFIYTDRGVYRPGDTIFAGFMLQSTAGQLPDNYPAVIEVYNARQQMVHRQANTSPVNGLYVYRVPTHAEMPTGRWNIVVTAGPSRFEHAVRVETIKPNRLKIDFEFGEPILFPNDRERAVKLSVNWLHGSVASGLETTVNMRMSATSFSPDGHKQYVFDDPARYWGDETLEVHKGVTDANGVLPFKLNIPQHTKPPCMLNLQFTARAMEKGGDITTSVYSMKYHPYSRYIGLLVPESSDNGYLHTDTTHVFELALLTNRGRPVANARLKVEIYKQSWSWWWASQGGRASYITTQTDNLVHSDEVLISDGKGRFSWRLDHPEWGSYYIRIMDENEGHSVGKMVYFDWPNWYSRQGRAAGAGASTLSISMDKESYETGETAVISFPSAEGGMALISLEKGDRQLRSWWEPTLKDETSIRIPVEHTFSPNIYAYIMVLQPHAQTQNDLPIRMYGLVMLPVVNQETKLLPVLSMPDELRPERRFDIKVSELNGKAMSYTIAMVDVGLLDLTNFRTPDPHAYFYSREALGLKTWDMFDYVIGAFGGRIEQVFAIGGDEAAIARERARQSRFVPVVQFLGPFSLSRNAENTHSLNMPNYIGSVRVMLAATSGQSFGDADKTAFVKQPLMVLGTLPRVLRPGDEVALPVTVFSGMKGSQQVELGVKVDGNIALPGNAKQRLNFEREGEQMAYFRLKVPEKEGMASVAINASAGYETASYQMEIAVQNPNNRQYVTESYLLEPGKSVSFSPKMIGLPETRTNQIEFSGMPVVNLDKRLNYLNTFPYGCTEQITSAGFAQLYLAQFASQEDLVRRKTNQHIKSAIEKIVTRIQADGSLRYWPGGNYVNEFATVYAGHFMVLAAREGHPVPSYFISQWTRHQKSKATAWQPEVYATALLNDVEQAYRLYVLALAGETQTAPMNRLRENPRLSATAASLLGAAYAIAGQEAAARELILGKKDYVYHNHHYRHTFGSDLRDKAMRAEALTRLGDHAEAFREVSELATLLGKDSWLSTQETAYALYAVQLFLKQFPPQTREMTLELKEDNKAASGIQTAANYGSAKLDPATKQVSLDNKGTQPVFVNLLSSGIPLRENLDVVEKGLSMSVSWIDMAGNAINPSSLKQGMVFDMVVRVRNTSSETQSYLVLDQIIPAGWEIINKRLTGEEVRPSPADFIDIRDDRVTSFFDLARGQAKEFKISLIAAYEGKFYLPPASCSAMYNHQIQARKGGGEVVVAR